MLVAKQVNVLEAEGAEGVWRSTIAMSEKTFRMQIDSMYSDKIGAGVRELPSNAFDSQQRAKQDQPFFVHCPTALDPRFFVRDFGTGMTHEVMTGTYIVVGKSDKEETNDEVGMWGLGSKAPFAYVDQYNITCFDGETARHYGYGIGADGVPDLYLMQTEPCDEPRGVQVGYAVESKDFDAFKKAIQKVAMGFDEAFETNIPLKRLDGVAFKGGDWTAYKDAGELLGRNERWFARQGCVLYPISATHVQGLPNDYQSKLTYVLDCPIGTIRVTPSRESIEYREEVIEYLQGRIRALKEEVKASVWEAVKEISSVPAFFKKIEEIKPSFVDGPFEHPATGLTSPVLPAKWPLAFFSPKFVDRARWEFGTPDKIDLKGSTHKRIHLIDDISALYDPSRADDEVGLSKSELRRVSRFIRAYLEKQKISDAFFVLNASWDADFRRACFGADVEFVSIAFSDLRDAVPRRVAPPQVQSTPPIRGLALAKGAGEQKPVFEIKAESGYASVTSEQYRRQASALFKLAKRFDIASLYIAAPAVEPLLAAEGVPTLMESIGLKLQAAELTFDAWYIAKDRLGAYYIKDYVAFLRKLKATSAGTYETLCAADGVISTIARHIKPFLNTDDTELPAEEKKALDTLLAGDGGKSYKPTLPVELKDFDAALKVFESYYSDPLLSFAKSLNDLRTPERIENAALALVAVQSLLPPMKKA